MAERTPVKTRRYDGTGRADTARRTRARVLAAARRIFVERGYASTTMRAIADEAGVSVKTVEKAFATKANVLKVLFDVGMAGDDEPIAIADRHVVADMVAEADPRKFVALHAQFAADISFRIAPITRVLEQGAQVDLDLAQLRRTSEEQRYKGARSAVENLAKKTRLRLDVDTAADVLWALTDPVMYERLTVERGWTHQQVIGWLADCEARLLLP